MYEITKEFRFEAAHHLPFHDGKCRNLHGHSYRVEVKYFRPNSDIPTSGPKQGMVVDFADVKARVAPIIEALDHSNLNEVLGHDVTTAENIAAFIYKEIKCEGGKEKLKSVTVWETATSSATYWETF